MKRGSLSGLALTLMALALAVLWQGCGLNPSEKPIPPVPPPKFPPESPEEVLENVQWAYKQFEYERYHPLILPAFEFYINTEDIGTIPDDLAPGGKWNAATELDLARNMMDQNFVPSDESGDRPDLRIDSMEMVLDISEDLQPTNLEGAPPGTQYGRVNFDLKVFTAGDVTFDVNSRPNFYFSPDSSKAPVTWAIWRIDDAAHTSQPG